MSNLLKVSTLRLPRHWDRETQEVAILKLSFISEEALELHLLRRDERRSILAKVEKELQRVSDQRFGSSKVRVKCKSLKSGSLEIIVTLGMTYKFFKEYPDIRIGVTLFIEDLNKVGKKLHELLFTECRNALRAASARLSRKVSETTLEQLQELQQELQLTTPTRYVEVTKPFQYGMGVRISSRVKNVIDALRRKNTPAADERAKLSVRERTALKSLESRALTLRELAGEMGLSVEKSRYLIGRLRVKGLVVEADRSGREKRWRKRQDSLGN